MYVNSCNLYYETPYRGKSLQEIYYYYYILLLFIIQRNRAEIGKR